MHRRVRALFYGLRTEGAGSGREAAAIGLGIFIGCLPVYGFHLMLCWGLGWLFKLNRLKVYLAANISNPLFAPTLVFVEVQIGAWLRRGAIHPLTIDTVKVANLSGLGADALIGGLLVGLVLGGGMAATTYAMSRAAADELFLRLVRDASDRYITTSVTAWEFARGKLRGDPVYRAIACGGLLPSGGTIVDIGCGQGLMLALLAEAERHVAAGTWPPGRPLPPRFDARVGIELRTRAAQIARNALDGDAQIINGDIRTVPPIACRAALLLDVLHMIPKAAQEAVIAAAAAALDPGGVILVREADAAAGWRFTTVRFVNRTKAIVFGSWRQRFYFRTTAEWIACFADHGLSASVEPMTSSPFANVLFHLTR